MADIHFDPSCESLEQATPPVRMGLHQSPVVDLRPPLSTSLDRHSAVGGSQLSMLLGDTGASRL